MSDDFPEPLGPRTATFSWAAMRRFTPCSTLRPPRRMSALRRSSKGTDICGKSLGLGRGGGRFDAAAFATVEAAQDLALPRRRLPTLEERHRPGAVLADQGAQKVRALVAERDEAGQGGEKRAVFHGCSIIPGWGKVKPPKKGSPASFFGDELERDRVDAVAQTGGLGAVVEDVAQVRAAAGAVH